MEREEYGSEEEMRRKAAEELHECKEKKKELELTLSELEFHLEYIPKRRDSVKMSAVIYFILIFFLTLFVVIDIFYIILYIVNYEELRYVMGSGHLLLGAVLFSPFAGYGDFLLMRKEREFLAMLHVGNHSSKAEQFCLKHGILTFERDEEKTEKAIRMVKEQIAFLEERMKDLAGKQGEPVSEQE